MQIQGILISAGHGLGPDGSIDNGAFGNGANERDEVVGICRLLIESLSGLGMEIIPVGIDERLSVIQKTNKINGLCEAKGWKKTDAILIEVHMNSGPSAARGLEAWYSDGKPDATGLCSAILASLSNGTGMPIRATPVIRSSLNRYGRLGILDDTIPLSCLLEVGFITNAIDAKIVRDYKPSIASAILEGLRDFLHLPMPDFYTDVPADAWYHDAVAFCKDHGIFIMSPDGLFRPDQPMTRAEMAMVIDRLLRSFGK